MKHRKLRIAWSVGCGNAHPEPTTATLLLLGMPGVWASNCVPSENFRETPGGVEDF
jgi:hypothetical protein